MKIKMFESEFDDGLYICFKTYERINRIADIIKSNGIAELLDRVVGICSIMNFYRSGDFKFDLILHEDLGLCFRLPVERDRCEDERNYEKLRKIGNKINAILNANRK
jgi:hypothetical protein